MIKNFKYFILCFFVNVLAVNAQIKLPKLISDGMVLQRDTNIKIWGWASPNENITIHFSEDKYKISANEKGEWELPLKNLKAGGPFTMKLEGKNYIEIHDILIGDVWLCSGQSNMAYELKKSEKLYKKDIENSKNQYIRQFLVPNKYNFKNPDKDISTGKWIAANKQTVGKFSAVAYFFANELYQRYKIPIGLINSSVGGTPAQAWISEDGLKKFPHYYEETQLLKNDEHLTEIENSNKDHLNNWITKANTNDLGTISKEQQWSEEAFDDQNWDQMNLPGFWVKEKLGPTQGIVWFRKTVELSSISDQENALLSLGRISDADSVFVNGTFVGASSHKFAHRNYKVPSTILKEGKNTIAVKVTSYRFNGGFIPGNKIELALKTNKINLKGPWKYKLGVKMKQLDKPVQLTRKPTGLYNAMIAPLLNYSIKGAIWYQGEGNASKAKEYNTLFPALISDWRYNFKQGDFPFLFVQLANFQKPVKNPAPSNWASLREAQLKTLSVSNTGMAVIIDIGEANDIHPKNKKDVGKRLAIEAERVAYKTSELKLPQYESMKISGNKIILSFDTFGSDLKVKNNSELKEFAIAGADKKFVWAKAEIKNGKIIVYNETIKEPVAVRYAWSNNPDKANLLSSESLPLSPFRTDDWPL